MRIPILAAMLAALALPAAVPPAWAQAYPSKPIRLLTQFGPGTPGEISARILAVQMSPSIGQTVIVEARPGGGGVLVASQVARAAPDGYTVLQLTSTVPIINPVMSATAMPFDPAKDLMPIAELTESPILIVVHQALPVTSLRELIDYAKKYPGKLSYGTTGVGSTHHLNGEQLKILTGADLVHVPYKTSPVVDAAAGVIPVAYSVGAQALSLIRAGKIRPIALTGSRRWKAVPGVPTLAEVVPGFETAPAGIGLWGPAGIPAPIVSRLHAEAVKAVSSPEAAAKLAEIGFDPSPSKSAEDYAATVRRQIAMVRKIVEAAGIKGQ